MKESWVKIKDFNYLISDIGRVWSIKNKIILSPSINRYARVTLCKNNKVYYKQIHRLVANTFIPNPKNKPYVNHKDGNKLDNCVFNLEWVTPQENSIHAANLGLCYFKGENNLSSKLTEKDVLSIRNTYSNSKTSQRKLSKEYNVSQTLIRYIVSRKLWKHI